MATCSNILACEISWTEEPGGLQSIGLQKSQTKLSENQGRERKLQLRIFVSELQRRWVYLCNVTGKI